MRFHMKNIIDRSISINKVGKMLIRVPFDLHRTPIPFYKIYDIEKVFLYIIIMLFLDFIKNYLIIIFVANAIY